MSSTVSNYQQNLDNIVFDDKLPNNICNKILDTIKLEDYGIILNKDIYQKLLKVFIIDNENKDLKLIKTKINTLFESLSLNCWITFNNNNGKTIYKINFNLDYILDDNLNNINIYTCLNMIKNYINNNDDSEKINIPVKLYNYLMIYITKQKEKNDNYFETEYCNIVEFFSNNKIDLSLINKSSNDYYKVYYELIFSKINTNDENSIKSTSDNDNINLITDNTNFPDLTDNKQTQHLKKVLNYSSIKNNLYEKNIIDDVKEEVIDNIKEEVIDNIKEEVIDNIKEEIIDDVKEEVIIDDVKEVIIDDVKEVIIDDVKEEIINDVKEEVIINNVKEVIIDDVKEVIIDDVKEEVIVDDIKEEFSVNNVEEENSHQKISGAFCQGQIQLSGDNEHDNFVFTMNGIKDGNNLNLHFSITGLCNANGVPIRIPVKINFPFDEAMDNRNVMFSPVSNNY